MKIAIKNEKSVEHKILRFNGVVEILPPNQYKILDLTMNSEIKFWNSVTNTELSHQGLHLVKDDKVVNKIEKLIPTNVTMIDKDGLNTYKEPEILTSNISTDTIEPETVVENKDLQEDVINDTYTEDQLNSMSKGELMVILDLKNITYKKNSSSYNLVKLILGSE